MEYFLSREIRRARWGTQKLSTRIKGKKWSPLFCEYVNGHFSMENNTRGSTYSTVEYAKKKNIINDDDDGTVWHRLSLLNTIYERYNEQYINHRHRAYWCINYVLLFAVFTIILLVPYTGTLSLRPTMGPQNIETGDTWPIFNVFNWNWVGCSSKFNVLYVKTIVSYRPTQRQS